MFNTLFILSSLLTGLSCLVLLVVRKSHGGFWRGIVTLLGFVSLYSLVSVFQMHYAKAGLVEINAGAAVYRTLIASFFTYSAYYAIKDTAFKNKEGAAIDKAVDSMLEEING